MRYLVTGGAGFIGSHLVETLLERGDDVSVLDDFSTGRRSNIEPWLGRIRLTEGSITDPAACAEAAAEADFVLHQAALPSVPRSIADPMATHEACATGTLNVLIAARKAGVKRVIYAASSSAYGDTVELPKHERMTPRPRSPYATAKLCGEQYCHAFTTTYGLETVSLRYFNVFGPRQDPESPYAAVIPKFITAGLRGVAPQIFGDGEQTRDFTYVANAVSANLLACTAPSAATGAVYNVGCGERVSLNRLWELVSEITGAKQKPEYAAPRTGDVRDSLASLDAIGANLGYAPVVSLKEGLRLTLASLE